MKSGRWAIFEVGDKWNQKLRDFIDKKVVVGGEAIGMIYVAIKKVICSLDLAASSLHGGQNNSKTTLKKNDLQHFPISSAVF